MTEQPLDDTITPTPTTRKTNTNTQPGEPALAQVLIRTTPDNRERWKQAADRQGISLSELARTLLDKHTTELLDCQHPHRARRTYPWSAFCLDCGQRLK